MNIKKLFILFISISMFGIIHAQDFSAKADEYINQLVENKQFSGNVLIAQGKKIIYLGSKGYANRAFKVKNTPATKFRIGSITKQFTAFSVLLLVEKGQIKLTDHISDHIPNYPKPYGDQITIHQLLTHTSGIPNYTSDETFFKGRACLEGSQDDLIKQFWNKPLDFTPGSKFSYSNSGYYLLGVILNKVNSYEGLLKEILDPTQMYDSGLEEAKRVIPNLSSGYSRLGRHAQNCGLIKPNLAAFSAGAMYSTTSDLYKWHLLLNDNEFISDELMTKYFTPEKDNYAYGWVISEIAGHPVQWHNGGIDGFVSFIGRFPKDDLFITILSNYEGAPVDKAANDLAKIYFGEEIHLPKMPKEIQVDPFIYESYVGTYKLAPTFDIVITQDGERLMLQATGQDKFQIYPESETLFFLKVVEAKVEFIVGENGKVAELILHQNGEQKGIKQ